MNWRKILCSGWLFLTIGCAAVGPDYRRPDPSMPKQFGSLEAGVTDAQSLPPEFLASWWKILNDPLLDEIMEQAVQGNLDLRIAQARLWQARALRGVSESGLYPEGGMGGQAQAYRRTESEAMGPAGLSRERQGEFYQAGFDASWEIDIFGGIRREVEAAEANLEAAREDWRSVLVSLQGEIARNYIELRGAQLRLEIARKDVEARRENVEINEARFRAGLVNQLDLTRTQGELSAAEARIPLLEKSIRASLYRLGILMGREPMSLIAALGPPKELPEITGILSAGLPSDLLRRRPDIRRVERELAAATARIGVSTAELFPKFSLTGAFGFQSENLDRLVREGSNFWQIGPTVRWSILNQKRIRNHIELSKAIREETLARYEKTILLSLEEVENALVILHQEKRRAASLVEAVEANRLAVDLALQRYKGGLQSYLAVLDAQAALYNAQDQLAQTRQNSLLGLIALYKAIGGGWKE
jgi:multidrug efflux system outer membrane protein